MSVHLCAYPWHARGIPSTCSERVVLLYPVQILAVFALSVVGGLLNRMRGGWAPYDRAHCEATNHVLSVLCHDGVDRAIISGPTGLLVGLCMMRWRRGATVAIGFAVLTYFSFFVGTYGVLPVARLCS